MKKRILKRLITGLLTSAILAGTWAAPLVLRAEETGKTGRALTEQVLTSEDEPEEIVPTITACGEIVNTYDNYGMDNIMDGKMGGERELWACNQNHETAGHHWFQVDLGKTKRLSACTIYHQGAYNQEDHYNTSDYTVEVSLDGQEWKEIGAFSNNTARKNIIILEQSAEIRYIRAMITKPAVNGNTTARIAEMTLTFDDGGKASVEACGELTGSDRYYKENIIDGVVDVDYNTWVCADTKHSEGAGHHYFIIDLGKVLPLKYYILYHQTAFRPTENKFTTRDYTVWGSADKLYWEPLETVERNTSGVRRHELETALPVRYVKVEITDPGFSGDCKARLPEMKLFGEGDVNLITKEVETTTSAVLLYSGLEGQRVTSVADLSGGGTYLNYDMVTVTAPQRPGYAFRGWYPVTEVREADGQKIITYGSNPISTELNYEFHIKKEEKKLVAIYAAEGTVTLTADGADFTVNGENVNDSYNKEFRIGDQITLCYTGSDSFGYWKNGSDKIVSSKKEYTFTIVSDTSLTPVTEKMEQGTSAYVEFISAYGQVIAAETWEADREGAYSLPHGPNKLGGTFLGWSMDGKAVAEVSDILVMIREGKERRITVKPLYKETDTVYTVTIHYPGMNREDEVHDGLKEGTGFYVTAPAVDGMQFSHWSSLQDGSTILSCSERYFIRISRNMELYAIYGQQESIHRPVIVMTNQYAGIVDGSKKVSFEATRDVTEGYELVESGILWTTNEELATGAQISVDGAGVKKKTSNDTSRQGVYTLNIGVGVQTDRVICVRGYLIVKNVANGIIETIYTDVVSGSFESLSAQ